MLVTASPESRAARLAKVDAINDAAAAKAVAESDSARAQYFERVYGVKEELPTNYDVTKQRYPLRSYGWGLRLNLFNYAILRWDYAKPLDQPGRKGFWTWSLWPSF